MKTTHKQNLLAALLLGALALYTVRIYRPRKEILDGTWKFQEAEPVK